LLTAGIAKEWIIRQVGRTSTRMIDEHYGKWISADATGMAQFVSDRLGVSERLVPIWSHGGEEKPDFPLKSDRNMAVVAVSAGIVSRKFPENG
jgi:integrase